MAGRSLVAPAGDGVLRRWPTAARRRRRSRVWESGELQAKLSLVGITVVLVALHLRYSRAHALQAGIFLLSLAIVALGVGLAH